MLVIILDTCAVYIMLFVASIPFVGWYKFCTRHLSKEKKKEAFQNAIANIVFYWGWW